VRNTDRINEILPEYEKYCQYLLCSVSIFRVLPSKSFNGRQETIAAGPLLITDFPGGGG
jgi:hypothetical protein